MQIRFIILFSAIFLISCSNKKAEEKTETTDEKSEAIQTSGNTVILTPEQENNAGITTGKMELQSISSTLKVSGQVDVPPQNMVAISVPLGGYLQNTGLLPGMSIRKGQVLAVVQDQQYIQMQQDYLTARARLSYLEKEYARQRELNESKATSDKQFAANRSRLQNTAGYGSGLIRTVTAYKH